MRTHGEAVMRKGVDIKNNVVGVAQLVERLTVAQVVAGSNPVAHPIDLARKPEFEKFRLSVLRFPYSQIYIFFIEIASPRFAGFATTSVKTLHFSYLQ